MSAPLAPGITVDRLRIDSVVGAGSMGDVFLAHDLDLGRKVALKILSERHRDNDELRARFVREARAVAAISHPNVVQVFTTGNYDDRPYIAMEFLAGVDLGTDVREGGPWISRQAARAIRDAASGLDAAAKAGLIHRDVKPSNLVMLRDGSVKVTDFGLAKPLDPGDEPALTAMGVVVGTPDYIAPEQARGDKIDERVDIYALGGTLYYLLTGIPPFRTGRKNDDKYLKVVARHLREPPPDPRKRNPRADKELSLLVVRLMAKKRDQRPGYDELIAKLDRIAARLATGNDDLLRQTARVAGTGPEPTPYVGDGSSPRAHEVGADAAHDELDAAPTNVRMPTRPPVDGSRGDDTAPVVPADDFEIAAPRPARWLIAITVLSVIIFLVGLGLVLFGPVPARSAAGATSANAPASRAHAKAAEPPVPAAALPEPPPGMLLVRDAAGAPRAWVSARAVSWVDYQKVFPSQARPSGARDETPVTRVGFAYAGSFAEARGARLPTPDEWVAASHAAGFQSAGSRFWEWVDGGHPGAPQQEVRSLSTGKPEAMRDASGHSDVTFRLARDLK